MIVNDTAMTVLHPVLSDGAQESYSTKLSFRPSTGVLSAVQFNGSGAGLVSIPNTALVSSRIVIGSTPVELGSTYTVLTGLTSVTATIFDGTLRGHATSATSATNLTGGVSGGLPYQVADGITAFLDSGEMNQVLVSGTTPSWTNTPTISGANFTSIPNKALTHSAITLGTSTITLGATASSLAGLIAVTATTFNGALNGNAKTVTNGVYSAGDQTIGGNKTFSLGVSAPNFHDATSQHNVNLASGGTEGLGLVVGYSGGSYPGIGFNVQHTTVSGKWIAPRPDVSSYVMFNGGGFTFYGAPAGTIGRSLSYTQLVAISNTGILSATSFSGDAVGLFGHAQNLNIGGQANSAVTATHAITAGTATNLAGGTVEASTGAFTSITVSDLTSIKSNGDIVMTRADGKTGVLYFGVADRANRYLHFDGANFILRGGSLICSGNVTAFSDDRLKTNWQNLPANFVSRLADVQMGVYDRVDTLTTEVGVSAQSLQKLLPQAVHGTDDMLSVAYGNAALAACIALAREVKELKAELQALKGER